MMTSVNRIFGNEGVPERRTAATHEMMRRISKIRNRQEAEVEAKREELRDMRWRRHKSKILTATSAISMITVSGKLTSAAHWLQSVIG
jgi:hypothetical protein